MKKTLATAAVLALFAGPAFASSCPKHMAQIDEALKTANLSDAQMAEVKELRAEGEQQHKAGNHQASVDTLAKAKAILGIN
ncbi:hypothetical protein [Futiania mangrovi]|uniref:Uncharacterized protein n=1 Tax=Futiania mangrovi TaxID=2959716 RepID=A0A9J6PBB5_9PROT|nr:hypothetical protein [Futiania mangrovii]MCP1334992.1 hypothetical protein [Futiania mangrovii]